KFSLLTVDFQTYSPEICFHNIQDCFDICSINKACSTNIFYTLCWYPRIQLVRVVAEQIEEALLMTDFTTVTAWAYNLVANFARETQYGVNTPIQQKTKKKKMGHKCCAAANYEFWLFLTRLRVGLLERDLAFRFNISVPTVSDIIITWSNYMYIMLGSLPVWTSSEVIKLHLPEAFRGRFENVRCIIDCTEVKCEKPQDLQKQSEFYSEYKAHNTYKGLVGISPNVWVTFVSNLYGGSISDREIVEKSHFIDLLEHPDVIMADRGFEDILATKQVRLFIPPKRQSKMDQFSKEDCFETMRIANVRIHIERAIRRVKGWHIFDQMEVVASDESSLPKYIRNKIASAGIKCESLNVVVGAIASGVVVVVVASGGLLNERSNAPQLIDAHYDVICALFDTSPVNVSSY
ncbi:Hypothetical predicted protein, partial [Paramuricea clavata]